MTELEMYEADSIIKTANLKLLASSIDFNNLECFDVDLFELVESLLSN